MYFTLPSRSQAIGALRSQFPTHPPELTTVAEVALTLILLSTAGLVMKSFANARNLGLGFDPHLLLSARVDLPEPSYSDATKLSNFIEAMLAKLSALPGVRRVAVTNAAPVADSREGTSFTIEGAPPWPAGEEPHMNWNSVSPGYFDTLGIRVLRGLRRVA